MTSRIPAAVLAAISFIALGLTIARTSCATRAPRAGWIAADAVARSHGILGFEVIADRPRALEVRIDWIDPSLGQFALALQTPRALDARSAPGRPSAGWLHLRTNRNATEQTLTGFGAPLVVRTQRDQLALGRPGSERIVARRDPARGAWSGGALDAGDAEALARLLALDVSLAVQGSSLVFGGAVYASCTVRCTRAERCVHLGRPMAACAEDVVVCAACLERAP